MQLQLERPLAFFDIESTGINPATDRILELAIVRVAPDGSEARLRRLINPQMQIPAESTAIHGITNEMVKDAPVFRAVAAEINHFLENCDLGGFNSNRFDIPMLVEEFLRAGQPFDLNNRRLLDIQKIYHKMEPRTLSAAYQFYCHASLEDAHSAGADVDATWAVLNAQIARYPEIGHSLDSILKFVGEDRLVDVARRFVWKGEEIIFNFGKHKGKAVHIVLQQEPQYYDWMMRGDFSLHTKQVLTEILNRIVLKK